MPEKAYQHASISDSEKKHVTIRILVTWVNDCHTHFQGTNGVHNLTCAQRSITHKMTNINSIITNIYYITNNITESSRN
jgi:hypothetical protein